MIMPGKSRFSKTLHASVMALFAHCASLTVNAVKQPWERKPRAHQTADRLATMAALDMTAHWRPTVRTYLGRVTKAHILNAVREAVSEEAADRLSALKKQTMAEAAEQLLPGVLRTQEPSAFAKRQDDPARSSDIAELEPQAPKPEAANSALADSRTPADEGEPFNVAVE